MLDHLQGDDAAKRLIGEPAQVTARIGIGDVKPASPADFDHFGIEIEPARAYPLLLQQLQKFPPATTDIKDLRLTGEVLQVILLPRANLGFGTSKPIFESNVHRSFCRRGDLCS